MISDRAREVAIAHFEAERDAGRAAGNRAVAVIADDYIAEVRARTGTERPAAIVQRALDATGDGIAAARAVVAAHFREDVLGRDPGPATIVRAFIADIEAGRADRERVILLALRGLAMRGAA